jgi:hypothetical protein
MGILALVLFSFLVQSPLSNAELVRSSDVIAVVSLHGDEKWLVVPEYIHSGYVLSTDGKKTWRGADLNKGILGRVSQVRIEELLKDDSDGKLAVGGTLFIILPDVVLSHSSIQSFIKGPRYLVFLAKAEQRIYSQLGTTIPGKIKTLEPFKWEAGYTVIGGKSGKVILDEYGLRVQKATQDLLRK